MKKVLTPALALLTMLSLAPPAHADVVFSPVEIAGDYAAQALPWVLVGAAAAAAIFLLYRFWKKKK